MRHVFSMRTATQTTMEGEERCTFSSCKQSHYFEFLSAKDENNKVHCTVCAGNKVSSFKNTVKFQETFGVAAQHI